jgi:hypothetical protein
MGPLARHHQILPLTETILLSTEILPLVVVQEVKTIKPHPCTTARSGDRAVEAQPVDLVRLVRLVKVIPVDRERQHRGLVPSAVGVAAAQERLDQTELDRLVETGATA